MKNLKQEIEKISKTYPIIKTMLFVDGFEDDLLNLFRSWALECVGGIEKTDWIPTEDERVKAVARNLLRREIRRKLRRQRNE